MRASLWLVTCCCCLLAFSSRSLARAGDFRIHHHDLDAKLTIETHGLDVSDRVTVERSGETSAPLHFLLNRGLSLSRVRLDGHDLQWSVTDGFQPRDFWNRPPYDRLEDYEIAREWTVSAPAGGWPSQFSLELAYSGAVFDSLHAPKVAYQRSFDTTTGLIAQKGAFLSGATQWLPWCGEGTFSYDLLTNTPDGWESVSQGRRVERRVDAEGRVSTKWVEEHPMTEAYLVAGPYRVRQAKHGEVNLFTFTYENTPESLCQTYLDAAGKYLDLYDQMLGAYPFAKFALVENWWQTGFGMPSFTLLGDRVIRLPFIVHTSYGHEILHNWWGNGVFVDYEEGNWCEGLTTYLADHLYKSQESPQAAIDYRRAQLQAYLDYAVSGARDFALREFTERESASTQAVGYGKTMMVFHMAQLRAGDDAFFGALRRFYQKFLFREASWDDLVACFAQGSQLEWRNWFEQWIGRPGALQLSAALKDNPGASPQLVLRQEEPYFDVEVPVRVENAEGSRMHSVQLSGASATLSLDPTARVIEVDPDCDLFRRLKRAEIPPALSQTLGAEQSVVVIGSDTDPRMAQALRSLAEDWAKNQDMTVVNEDQFEDDAQRSVWLLGRGALARKILAEWRAYGDQPQELWQEAKGSGKSLVLTLRDPQDESRSWSLLLAADPELVAAVGAKLTHYGRYSYLEFEGEKNVKKGSFTVETSPLRLVREAR